MLGFVVELMLMLELMFELLLELVLELELMFVLMLVPVLALVLPGTWPYCQNSPRACVGPRVLPRVVSIELSGHRRKYIS
ncbi:Hypothetical Protein FCC1311_061472 [Hondaea fermentalgiana]|uniref:Uncharacterized protein n=1 Tax=Hondaea fermentalgiana TaxID=2315210 RepID=A0A2R5GGB4_9STRA|nr:Hypothetical Protein FCC1311_061472 [Hondaea fermentalgiana]|eukprot:GBG29927.1 Hypothetical Protein FCC1311_061472 [Hondaea fermentalgiana]